MISLTPDGSPAETSAVQTLLDIIKDPVAAQKRLDDLVAEKKVAQDRIIAADKAEARVKQSHAAAAAKLAEMQKATDDFQADHEARTKALDDRHAVLLGEAERVTKYEEAVAAREKELIEPMTAREKAVAGREADVTKREATLRTLEAQAQAVKEDYEAKLAKLKEAVT